MNNVVQFPDLTARNWADAQRVMLEITRMAGVSDDVAVELLARSKPLFDILNEPIRFTFDKQAALTPEAIHDVIAVALKEQCDRILFERMYREIQICRDNGLI